MNNLESIVPPLELCKRIPAGKFEDSCFIWCWEDSDDPRAWRFVLYRSPKGEDLEMHQKCVCPAPTLAEIMAELPEYTTVYRNRNRWQVYIADCGDRGMVTADDPDNPAAAALRLYLEVAK